MAAVFFYHFLIWHFYVGFSGNNLLSPSQRLHVIVATLGSRCDTSLRPVCLRHPKPPVALGSFPPTIPSRNSTGRECYLLPASAGTVDLREQLCPVSIGLLLAIVLLVGQRDICTIFRSLVVNNLNFACYFSLTLNYLIDSTQL